MPASPLAVASPNVLLAAAALIGAVLIGGVAFVLAMGGAGPGAVDGPATESPRTAVETSAAGFGDLIVDVAGAVAQPGVYHLPAGSRVGDAVDAAGGFGPRVDVERVAQELNLAATLTDGQQIRVPSRDDAARGTGTGSSGGNGAGGTGSDGSGNAGGPTGKLVDINTATQAELEALPGIGPVTATKIIASRAEAQFRTVDELRERGLVGEKTFGDLRALITVG
ncbi:MAG TPA: ComEA family DNA-binding protein [Candidatus Limnocylindrales bacterium]|nr:ComEA family DNA-binding protein [Candidatus Limnocylindrales bacterium]